MPIDADIGNTFANCLRSILRQDPDKILVGEIRDLETAEIAVQASLTGHLVFSTLHTNDAPSTITRLRDMGVPPFLITATLEAVLAQRLVRKICPSAASKPCPAPTSLAELDLARRRVGRSSTAAGLPGCNNTGFKGRTGLFEFIINDDHPRPDHARGRSTDSSGRLRKAACRASGHESA
jgi:type IV pilus assembly protein PilB